MFRQSLLRLEHKQVADCERKAFVKYGEEFRVAGDLEAYVTQEITSVVTELVRLPKGNSLVTVSILTRQPHNAATYVFRLQTAGRRVEIVSGP